jgi:hypothetical protein
MRRVLVLRMRLGRTLLASLVLAFPATAEEPAQLQSEVEELRAKVAELEASRDAALRQIDDLRVMFDALQARVEAPPAPGAQGGPLAVPAIASGSQRNRTVLAGPERLAQNEPGAAAGAASPDGETVGEDKAEARRFQAERAILERQGGVLVPAGQLVIEPGMQYSNSQRNLLNLSGVSFLEAIFIGRINVDSIDRDVYTPSVEMRYGLHRRVELEASIPYTWRSDQIATDVGGAREEVESQGNFGFGDVQLGVFTQLFFQENWWPDTVLNFQVKVPTGEDPFEVDDDEVPLGLGTWGVSAGLTMVRTIDPAVLFGSIRYIWDIENDFGYDHVSRDDRVAARRDGTRAPRTGPGKIDFGDTIEYSLGMAFALNERLAMTMSLQHSLTSETQSNGSSIIGSDLNSARLFLGGSYRMSQLATVNLNLGLGITEDAPDYTLEVSVPLRMPYRFPHFDF